MKWFSKRPQIQVKATRTHEHDDRVEVVVHKNATEEAITKAKEANQKLNELLEQNHFTLKIYLATGGQIKQKQRNK